VVWEIFLNTGKAVEIVREYLPHRTFVYHVNICVMTDVCLRHYCRPNSTGVAGRVLWSLSWPVEFSWVGSGYVALHIHRECHFENGNKSVEKSEFHNDWIMIAYIVTVSYW